MVAVRRFETPPGKQAQVDWGHLGSIAEDGEERQLWGFTIALGYSRRMMAAAATDQKLGTLLRMHELAFSQWGCVPEEILYDRMKTVWTGTDDRGEIVWNAVFLDFADHRRRFMAGLIRISQAELLCVWSGASRRGCAGHTGRRPKARSNPE